MGVNTISQPTADERLIYAVNRRCKKGNRVANVAAGQRIAVVLLRLGAGVGSDQYARIGQAIQAIQGIDDVDLLVDGRTPASIPKGHQVDVNCSAAMRITRVV